MTVWNFFFILDPMLLTLVFKTITNIFFYIISTKGTNLSLCLIFNPHIKVFKCFKLFILGFQQIYKTHSSIIINKCHDIFISIYRSYRNRTTKILMNQTKFSTCSRIGVMVQKNLSQALWFTIYVPSSVGSSLQRHVGPCGIYKIAILILE